MIEVAFFIIHRPNSFLLSKCVQKSLLFSLFSLVFRLRFFATFLFFPLSGFPFPRPVNRGSFRCFLVTSSFFLSHSLLLLLLFSLLLSSLMCRYLHAIIAAQIITRINAKGRRPLRRRKPVSASSSTSHPADQVKSRLRESCARRAMECIAFRLSNRIATACSSRLLIILCVPAHAQDSRSKFLCLFILGSLCFSCSLFYFSLSLNGTSSM